MFRPVAVVLLVVLTCVACGGENAEPESRFSRDDVTQRMVDALTDEGSFRLSLTAGSGAQGVRMRADQVVGETFDDTSLAATYDGPGEEDLELVIVDGLVFTKVEGESSFVRVDPRKPETDFGRAIAPIVDELDITSSIAQFDDAITSVKRDGDARTIDGVRTEPYRLTIDVDTALGNGALDQDSGLRPGTTVDYVMFFDADDLVHRIDVEAGPSTARVDLGDFGEIDPIEAPADDQVISETDYVGGG